jgi:hypothetical protein
MLRISRPLVEVVIVREYVASVPELPSHIRRAHEPPVTQVTGPPHTAPRTTKE